MLGNWVALGELCWYSKLGISWGKIFEVKFEVAEGIEGHGAPYIFGELLG